MEFVGAILFMLLLGLAALAPAAAREIRERRAKRLVAAMGDADIHVQIRTFEDSDTGLMVTIARAELQRPWDDLRCELGGVSRPGALELIDEDEVQALYCSIRSQPCREALEDRHLQAAIRQLLLAGGAVAGGVVYVRRPGSPSPVELAQMHSLVAEVVRRLGWGVPMPQSGR